MRSLTSSLQRLLLPASGLRFVPRWLPLGFFAAAAFLVPWSTYLLLTLPHDAEANHWALAWTGFDVGMLVALFFTALLSLKRSVLTAFWATMTGTITMIDAWFDVLTSQGREAQVSAIVLAVVGEIPISILCFWWARRIFRALDKTITQLGRDGWRVHDGQLVPPPQHR